MRAIGRRKRCDPGEAPHCKEGAKKKPLFHRLCHFTLEYCVHLPESLCQSLSLLPDWSVVWDLSFHEERPHEGERVERPFPPEYEPVDLSPLPFKPEYGPEVLTCHPDDCHLS